LEKAARLAVVAVGSWAGSSAKATVVVRKEA